MAQFDALSLAAFAQTQWSLVQRAGDPWAAEGQASRAALLKRYLPALRAYLILDRKIAPEPAEDLLQGFVADKIVEHQLISRADPAKGRFRSFLLVALNRYVIDQSRRDTTRGFDRGNGLDLADCLEATSKELCPSKQFDIAWARELIADALDRVRGECIAADREDVWAVFECRVVKPAFEGAAPLPYAELVSQFKLQSPLQVYALLTTGKRMFARNLRSAAARYAEGDALIEQEIDDLRSIVSQGRA